MTTPTSSEKSVPIQDDRILLQTRLILIVVIPFLLLAFLILYIFQISQANALPGRSSRI